MPSCKVTLLTVLDACAGQWLQVLQLLLQILEVPSTIVTGVRSPFCLSMRKGPTPSPCSCRCCSPIRGPIVLHRCAVRHGCLCGRGLYIRPTVAERFRDCRAECEPDRRHAGGLWAQRSAGLTAQVTIVALHLGEGAQARPAPGQPGAMAGPQRQLRHAGGLTRAEGQDRIDFLAQVRNAALEPLWRGAGNGSAWGAEGGFKADRVVFLNDVYFCARDVVSPPLCHMLASLASPAPGSWGLWVCCSLHDPWSE